MSGTSTNAGTVAAAGTVTSTPTIASSGTVVAGGTIASTGTSSAAKPAVAAPAPAPSQVFYVVADPTTGVITQHGHIPAANSAAAITAMKATVISQAQYAQVQRSTGAVALIGGAISPIAAQPIDLAKLRHSFGAKVDMAAEKAAAQFIGGSGQVLEYMATLAEARFVTTAPDPLDASKYPWLGADVAVNNTAAKPYTLRDAAAAAIAADVAWSAAGAAIKNVRLSAKAALASATTIAQMQLIVLGLKWPSKTGA